jgi:hypothetical protein
MSANRCVAESREVCSFDRVVLSVHNMMNQMQITQGEHESLTVEARPEILSKITTAVSGGELAIRLDGSLLDKLGFALSTSLTRPTVRYHLTVKSLTSLDLTGFVHVDATELHTGSLSLKLKGAGEITVGSLTAQHVAAALQGAGRIELSGQVEEQDVAIQGPGLYQALDLKSRRARVSLKGLGRARVWVIDELQVKVRGLGRVDFRGTPEINQDISPRAPLPRFGHLGSPERASWRLPQG